MCYGSGPHRLSGNPRLTRTDARAASGDREGRADEAEKANPNERGSYDDLRKLALRADELLRSPDVDGLVYVQGINTSRRPIVVTGAQRPFNALGPTRAGPFGGPPLQTALWD
jgi:hypothetical protein